MATNKQHQPGESALATRTANKIGLLARMLIFCRKAAIGIWSIGQLNKETQKALDCWTLACAATDRAIKRKAIALVQLERFGTWLAALEPQYKTRYAAALHARQRKLEVAVYEANYNFNGLNKQEQRWIKRLIKLKSTISFFVIQNNQKNLAQ